MANANCQLDLPKVNDERGLTVGDKFILHCDASIAALKNPELRLDQNDQYKLQLLAVQKTEQGVDLLLTSYKAGDHQLRAVQLVDAEQSVILGDFNFSIRSVLPKTQPGQAPPEPYGPRGPLQLHLPWTYYLAWVLPIVVAVGLLALFARRRLQRRKLLQELEERYRGLDPDLQVGQFLRQWRRQLESAPTHSVGAAQQQVRDVQSAIGLYAARVFAEPRLVQDLQKDSQSPKFIKAFRNFDSSLLPLVRQFTHESNAILHLPVTEGGKVQSQDLQQILHLAAQLTDQVAILRYRQKEST